MNVLIFLFLILFFCLSKIRLEWAAMLILATLPSYLIRFDIFGIPFTLLEAMILIAFFVWFLNSYKNILNNIKNKLKSKTVKLNNRYPFDVEIILLLVISFVAIGVAGFSQEALGVWKAYFFEPLLFYILLFNIFANKNIVNFLNCIILPLSVSAFFVSALAIYQKITGDFIVNPLWAAEATRRVTSFFEYPNAVGLYLAPLVLIMLGWAISNFKKINKFKFLFILINICLAIMAIYFARSEGSLIGIIAGLIIFGFLANKKIKIFTIGLIILGGIVIGINQPLKSYVISKTTLRDLSGEIRKQQWRETWKMQTENPINFIFGTGLASYQKNILPLHQNGIFFNRDNDPDFHRHTVFNEEYRKNHWQPVEIYLYPHNIFLNFWTELGLAGMILFGWIIIKFFYLNLKLIKNYKYLTLGLIGAMIVIVIHGLVDVPYFKNDLSVLFWILIMMAGFMNIKK